MKDTDHLLFETIIGSHMWKMDTPNSDKDIGRVYVCNTRDILLEDKRKGKQSKTEDGNDVVTYSLYKVIQQLKRANVNYIFIVMTPLIVKDPKNALKELRQICAEQISKAIYHQVCAVVKHNMYHYIQKGDRESELYQKKLNIVGRTLQFGINALAWGKYMFEPIHVKDDMHILDMKAKLDQLYQSCNLPEKPDQKVFDEYLYKWRTKFIKKELCG